MNYLPGLTKPLKAPMVPQVKLKVHAQMVGMLQTFVFQKMGVQSGHYLKTVRISIILTVGMVGFLMIMNMKPVAP